VTNTVLDESVLHMVRAEDTSFRVSDVDNEWLFTRDPVDSTPWVVLLRMPMSSLLNPIYAAALQRVLLMLGMAGFMSILLLRFWRQMRQRVGGLQRAAAQWSHGNWSFRTTILGVDEFAEVHSAFNSMAHQIQDLFTREQQIKTELVDTQEVLEERVQERTYELAQTVAELRELIEERKRTETRLRVLSGVSEIVADGRVDREALSRVAQLIAPIMADTCVVGWLTEGRALEWGASCGSPALTESSEAMAIVSNACEQRTEFLWSAPPSDHARQPGAAVDVLERLGYASVLVVPVVAQGLGAGMVALGRTNGQRPLVEDDRAWVRAVASRIALAADHASLQTTIAERGEQLQQLVARLFTAQEEERRQVAYDVHDGLAQVAAATHQRLESLAANYHPRSTRTRNDLQRARELAKHTVREARRIIAGLRPAVLDDYGLSAALQHEAEQLRIDGWDVTLVSHLAAERLPSAVELALYRVSQEAVTNVRKHAMGAHVRISLERHGTIIRLDVADDGAGFDLAALEARGAAGDRVGVAGMRERLALLGGRCQVQSRPGGGTSVVAEITVPLIGADAAGGDTHNER
jgi:signal transduction histidine kinase